MRALLVLLFAVGGPGAALAEGGHSFDWFAGLKSSSVTTGAGTHVGGGGFVEYAVDHEWLEVELSVQAFGEHGDVLLPVEMVLKKPFHLTDAVHPFVGAGPMVAVLFAGENAAHFGGLVTGGTYVWFSDHLGLLAAGTYGVVSDRALVHEVGGSLGLVAGF